MDYILFGSGFSGIPDNAVGILARANDNPLEFIETDNPINLFSISQKTDTQLTMSPVQLITHTIDSYLGAIVSEDRQTIYWVNDTNPLPLIFNIF